ncbi:MerR family transcriptional regulator [Paenibacillus turicensis]|uniref:MerR family transcriptional regulator n=1 Tax=Paenibacillus turicensis TaxID=160487 RepID=UPI003D2AE863
MKDEITISELAKLMQVSIHQIRYFEEKGILMPAYIADNQYRMYGIDEIYRLAHILLLRKMGLSVQIIKECLTGLSSVQMRSLFSQALSDTEAAIAQLIDTKYFITRLLQEQESLDDKQKNEDENEALYSIVQREEMALSLWFRMEEPATLNAKLLTQHQGKVPNLFEADIHYIYDQSGGVGIYTPSHQANDNQESDNIASGDLVLPIGTYLSHRLLVTNEMELDEHISQFYDLVTRQGYDEDGPLIIVEKSYLSLFTQQQIHYELLLKLKGRGLQ